LSSSERSWPAELEDLIFLEGSPILRSTGKSVSSTDGLTSKVEGLIRLPEGSWGRRRNSDLISHSFFIRLMAAENFGQNESVLCVCDDYNSLEIGISNPLSLNHFD